MKRFLGITLFAAAFTSGALGWPIQAEAGSRYYTQQCAGCHGSTPTTCAGCHRHMGTIAGKTDATSYSAGATVTAVITGGNQPGWVRGVLYDQSGAEIARASKVSFPITLTAPAPATAGTYTWSVGWYGASDNSGGGTADPNNANHGTVKVAMSPFTVTGSSQSDTVVSATSLAFGTVIVNSSRSLAFSVSNTGSQALDITLERASGTSGEYTFSPASFNLVAGGRKLVIATYQPTSAGADSGSLTIRSNATAQPPINVALSGTGLSDPYPGCIPSSPGHTTNLDCKQCHSTNPCSSSHH